jgi:hypothetical protein
MPKKVLKRIWFVHSCGSKTEAVLMTELNLRDSSYEVVEDVDSTGLITNKELKLVRLHSYDEIQYLRRNREVFKINFKVFVQDNPDKIYRWPHDC